MFADLEIGLKQSVADDAPSVLSVIIPQLQPQNDQALLSFKLDSNMDRTGK